MRLVWRLLLWFGVTALVAVLVELTLVPSGLVGSASATLVGAIVAGGVCLALDGRGFGALGFHLAASVPRELASGLALGVGLTVVVVGSMALFGLVGWTSDAGTMGQWLGGAWGALALLALPAASEEALLRGYPLQALSEAWGPAWGLAFTSLAFGSLHLANPGATWLGAANTGAAGLFLGAVYLRTGSLWWATAAHLGWNWGIGYLADLPVSGLEIIDAPLVEGTAHGPAWLAGGAFGPEGSVFATAGFLAAAALCWWGPWPRREPEAAARRPLAFLEDGRTDTTARIPGPTA